MKFFGDPICIPSETLGNEWGTGPHSGTGVSSVTAPSKAAPVLDGEKYTKAIKFKEWYWYFII